MSASGRTNDEDRRLSASISMLTRTMESLRSCPDIACLRRDIRKLRTLTRANLDLWNPKSDDDYIVLGLRSTIAKILEIIENNPNFYFNFDDRTISRQYQDIIEDIEIIFESLHMPVQISTTMDTTRDLDIARRLDDEINRETRRQEEIEREREESRLREEETRQIFERMEIIERERQQRLDEEFEESMRVLKQLEKEKEEFEEAEVYDYDDLEENDDFGEVSPDEDE